MVNDPIFIALYLPSMVRFRFFSCPFDSIGFFFFNFVTFMPLMVRIKSLDKELKTNAMYTLVYCKFRLFFSLLVPSLKRSEDRPVYW